MLPASGWWGSRRTRWGCPASIVPGTPCRRRRHGARRDAPEQHQQAQRPSLRLPGELSSLSLYLSSLSLRLMHFISVSVSFLLSLILSLLKTYPIITKSCAVSGRFVLSKFYTGMFLTS